MNTRLIKIWNILEYIIRWFLEKCFKYFFKKVEKNKINAILQFIKFGIVGLLNTLISYVTYAVLIKIEISYLIANIIAFLASVLNSFYWNNKYVFTCSDNAKRNKLSALVKTLISYGFTGLLLSSILLYLWIDILHISKYIAPIINLIITIPLNFIINKFWTFRRK